MLNNPLPFAGVRIVDFGQQIAAPAVAMIMADLGATVIHVDPPQGPSWDHPANAVLQRNKKCLNLDLKTPYGLKQAKKLIAKADIVIESFRPGTLKRLGLDLEAMREARPELVTLSVPGFASNDQLRREWKATEAIVAATCGAFTDMGFNRVLMGVNPSFSPLPLGSSYTITLAASSLALALFAREKSGRGDHIEVPVAAAMMEGLSYNSYLIEGLPERYKTMREHEIEYRQQNNIELNLSYDDLQEYLDPFYRSYKCADGRLFYCVCPSHKNHSVRALKVLGIYDEIMELGMPSVTDLHLPIAEWDAETSLGVYPLPQKWAALIAEKMKQAFLKKTSAEWGAIFGEEKIPGAPHRTTQEWVNDEHTNAAGLFVNVQDPELGLMKQPGLVTWFEGMDEQALTPTPRAFVTFSDALALLCEVQESEKVTRPTGQSVHAPSAKGWLEGIRILDLTNVIAGPHSTAFLSRFGAEVIKVDPVKPLYDPLIGTLFSFQTGVGKRSALFDILSPEGREALNRLIQSVDMVVINAPERQMQSLGLDHESLQAVHPGVLFCRLDCFGGPRRGPKTDYIGYDDIIQANSGIMSRFGGNETPEEHAHLGTLDVNCGFAAGLGMAMAFYHKLKTGNVTRVRTSLSAVTNLAQIPFALDYDGRAPFDEPSGREVLGFNAFSRFYQTQDSWMYLDATEADLPQLQTIEGLEGVQGTGDVFAQLQTVFKQAPTAYWVDQLHSAHIAVAEPQSIECLREAYSRHADGQPGIEYGSFAFSIFDDHPSGHRVTLIDPYAIRPSEARIYAVTPTESWGRSTREVLASVGYSDEAVDAMLAKGIAGLSWGKEFLPS